MRYVLCLILSAALAEQASAQYCPGGQCQPGVSINFPQAGWPGQYAPAPPQVAGIPWGYLQPSYQYGAPAWQGQPVPIQGGGCFGSTFGAPASYGYGCFTYGIPNYGGRAVFGQGYGIPDYRTR